MLAKIALSIFLVLTTAVGFAQPQSPADNERERRAVEREGRYDQRAHPHERFPRWCRGYDRRDYWIERRGCGTDWRCRARVNRKAERCGLR